MASPGTGPVNPGVPPVTITQAEQQPAALDNNFILSRDGKTAHKEFDVKMENGETRRLVITVHFPADCKTDADRNARLAHFTEDHIQAMGKYAITLGLGEASKSKAKKGKINAIHFQHDENGKLAEVERHYDSGGPKKIRETYEAKIKDPHYEEKYKKRMATLNDIIQIWDKEFLAINKPGNEEDAAGVIPDKKDAEKPVLENEAGAEQKTENVP